MNEGLGYGHCASSSFMQSLVPSCPEVSVMIKHQLYCLWHVYAGSSLRSATWSPHCLSFRLLLLSPSTSFYETVEELGYLADIFQPYGSVATSSESPSIIHPSIKFDPRHSEPMFSCYQNAYTKAKLCWRYLLNNRNLNVLNSALSSWKQ